MRFGFAFGLFVVLAATLGGVGIWTWVTISTFGNPSTRFSLVFMSVAVTNPVLRIVSIAVYALTATPVVFALIPVVLVLFGFIFLLPITLVFILIISCFKFRQTGCTRRIVTNGMSRLSTMQGFTTISLLGTITCDVLLIASTEITIAQNQVAKGDRVWTFGQTFALSVLIPSLWDIIKGHRLRKESMRNVSSNEGGGVVGSVRRISEVAKKRGDDSVAV
jgi:hypothetical protein